jgi:hypothetical protein
MDLNRNIWIGGVMKRLQGIDRDLKRILWIRIDIEGFGRFEMDKIGYKDT